MEQKEENKLKYIIKQKGIQIIAQLALWLPLLSISISSLNNKIKENNSEAIKNDLEETKMLSNKENKKQEIEKILQEKENSSKEQDKEIEEYLNILEKLGKTQKEYQQMKEALEIVKENVNVSPYEDTLYYDTISIGDEVFVIDDSVPTYVTKEDLAWGTNYKTSYYGTREIRLVSKIAMTKDYITTEVDNMEDYELLKSIGFSVVGYILVNQYSLKEDGSLEIEGRYEEIGVELVHKLKKKSHKLPEQEFLI